MLKKFVVSAVAVAAMGIATSAFAAVNHTQALAIARQEVPATAVNFETKDDANAILVNFRNNETYKEYYVKVNKDSGKVMGIEIKGSNYVGSTMKTQSEAKVKEAVLEAYPDAQNITIEYVKQGVNNMVYKATCETAKCSKVVLEVSPVTLALGDQVLTYK